jgi:hypothetical protein
MKSLRIIGCFVFLFAGSAAAQNPDTLLAKVNDTGGVQAGVIKVRKPRLTPFVKVEYNLYLADMNTVEILVPGPDNYPRRKRVPVYDSLKYPYTLERMYPGKAVLLSKFYAENMLYTYPSADTMRIDTMVVGLWIAKNGKVSHVDPDTTYTGGMPELMVSELYAISMNLEEWGSGGGYKTPKKFLKPSQPVGEGYYCEMYIIVSSAPLTEEQRNTGAAWSPFDFPLNSPPMDERQRDFLLRNGKGEFRPN